MATEQTVTLYQRNTETLSGTVTTPDGTPENLSGVTLEMVIKPGAQYADDDPAAVTLSTATGEITITAPAGGAYTVAVPEAVTATARLAVYHVDAVTDTTRRTIVHGPLTITDL